MPAPAIKSLASKAGIDEKAAEKLWSKAKGIVKEEYPEVKEDDDRYYALVTGVFKKMAGIKETVEGFESLCEASMSNIPPFAKSKKEDDEDDDDEDDEDGKKKKKAKKDKKDKK